MTGLLAKRTKQHNQTLYPPTTPPVNMFEQQQHSSWCGPEWTGSVGEMGGNRKCGSPLFADPQTHGMSFSTQSLINISPHKTAFVPPHPTHRQPRWCSGQGPPPCVSRTRTPDAACSCPNTCQQSADPGPPVSMPPAGSPAWRGSVCKAAGPYKTK